MNTRKSQEREPDNNDDEQNNGSEHSGEGRWHLEDLEEMEFVCTFLENEEDALPDYFDTKKVAKKKSESCMLCIKQLSGFKTSKNRRHHCRHCGMSVCNLCSQNRRRLSKLDKEKHRICD